MDLLLNKKYESTLCVICTLCIVRYSGSPLSDLLVVLHSTHITVSHGMSLVVRSYFDEIMLAQHNK